MSFPKTVVRCELKQLKGTSGNSASSKLYSSRKVYFPNGRSIVHQCLMCSYSSYHITSMKRHVRCHTDACNPEKEINQEKSISNPIQEKQDPENFSFLDAIKEIQDLFR
ncbi:hypothetical protein NPIL_406951 [Nephila pilipes]|uniref:Uncharacterized protein n=1 Tax=Nephila pilipes TaxID=299642 RepID=A0A8X6QU26_NEPPI|nr:hypothetical protein NPIL_406951 [Nephila pilipes]